MSRSSKYRGAKRRYPPRSLFKHSGSVLLVGALTAACVSESNSPGLEYMPDMYRSAAVEAYVDYAEVRGAYSEAAAQLVKEKFSFVPPAGTVPYNENSVTAQWMMPYRHGAPINADRTHGLYGVDQDAAGYEHAAFDSNPIPFSEEVLEEGKVLYERFCIVCHGEEGAGNGTVPATGKYPAPPSYKGPLKGLPEGQIFYSITYGKNAMGAYGSQLNKEERWKVAYYVQKLQGKELKADRQTDGDTLPDADGDGVADNLDQCPTEAGSPERNGCPETAEQMSQSPRENKGESDVGWAKTKPAADAFMYE